MLPVYLDLVLFTKLYQRFPGIQVPLAPRCNYSDIRLQSVDTQLKPDLIITLTGRTMGDRLGTCLVGNVYQTLGYQRPRDAGTQKILTLVNGVAAEHREYKIPNKLFAHVVDEYFFHPHARSLLSCGLQFFPLPQVSRVGNDLTVISLLQPLQDHRSVQTTGI